MKQLETQLPLGAAPPFHELQFLPKQREFIEAFWKYDYLLYAGGYGSGKTIIGCYAAILLSLLYPGNLGLIGREVGADLRDSTRRTFFEMLPSRFILRWKETEGHLWFVNGSEIIFRHLDEPTGLKSLTLGFAYVDEITDCRQSVFDMLLSRVRLPATLPDRAVLRDEGWLASKIAKDGVSGRKLFGTTNTDAPGHWVHQKWFGPPPPDGMGLPAAKRFAVHSASRENVYLPAEYLADMDASYDPRYHERYVQGKWVDISRDRTYYAFDRATHVRPCPLEPRLPIIECFDFNINPMASVILQEIGGEVRVIDEIVIKDSNTPQVCDEFLGRYESVLLRQKKRPCLYIYGDATGRTRGATTGKSDYAVIAQKYQHLPGVKFCVPKGNPVERDRVAATNAKLKSADGRIGIFIDPHCLHLIGDLELVHNKPGTQEMDAPTVSKIDKGADPLRTHISDSLGYYIAQRFPIKRPGSGLRTYNLRVLVGR